MVLLGRSDDPPALVALQTLIGAAGTGAAWGSWAGARWAPLAALGHGLATGGMLAALPILLDLPPEGRVGVWMGAAAMVAFGLWSAWYLSRPRR